MSRRLGAIVGRDGELALLSRFLAERTALPGGLLIVGDPGIGKTTLWEEGVAMAEAAGYRVLVCRPARAETQLSFAALSDLLLAELDEVMPLLPLPQRRALELALLLREAEDRPPDPHAIAAAALNAVRALSRERPLLLAIDDAQWLDHPSASALEYAMRRLRAEPVAVLASSRSEVSALPPLDLDRAFRSERLERLEVGPLSFGALYRLLHERTGRSFNRPSLRRIYDTSEGNPFYALELARAIDGAGQAAGEPLRLSPGLDELLGRRLNAFSEPTVDALFVTSAAIQPTVALVAAVLEAPAEPILAPAISAGIVLTEGGHIRFTHPLLASASYARPDDDRRRHWHARLAAASTDIEERARHQGLAATGPDPAVAALLHDAGRRAQARGAPTAAATLYEQAIAMTPPDQGEARVMRILDAGRVLLMTGDRTKARSLLEEAYSVLGEGPARSDALLLLVQVAEDDAGGFDRGLSLIEQALREAGSDGRRRAEALVLREFYEGNLGRFDLALKSSRAALAASEEGGDERLLTRALTRTAFNEVMLGLANEDARVHFSRAMKLNDSHPIDAYTAPSSMLAYCLLSAGRVDEARPHLVGQLARARDEGDEEGYAGLSTHLAELEWLAGNWIEALAHARNGGEVSEQVASRQMAGSGQFVVALVEASLGDVQAARAHATEGFNLCVEIGDSEFALQHHYVLGFLELSLGNPAKAHEYLAGYSIERGIEGSKRISFIGDEIAALVQLRDLEAASALANELERRGERLRRPMLTAIAHRGRGLIQGARGDPDGGIESLQRAVATFMTLNLPFERGRTLLALGEVRRRAKHKRAAREALDEAVAIFDELGASIWAANARAELARIGGRVSVGGLTPTERRVAELVASGRSNKEVAGELFVTVRAVEANLSRVYAKLGIRSRTELARRL